MSENSVVRERMNTPWEESDFLNSTAYVNGVRS